MIRLYLIRHWFRCLPERIVWWVAFRLPKRLVYFAAIRLMAHATSGQYGSESPGHVSILDALKRWEPA